MGECRSDECDRITKETWAWVIDYNVWLSVAYIPEKQKVVADKLSREFNMLAGGQLPLTILEKKMFAAFNTPSIDLFASSIIGRLRIYVSCHCDPDILLLGAFIINWDQFNHSSCVVACFLPTGKKLWKKGRVCLLSSHYIPLRYGSPFF